VLLKKKWPCYTENQIGSMVLFRGGLGTANINPCTFW